jgi:hypothetical protein
VLSKEGKLIEYSGDLKYFPIRDFLQQFAKERDSPNVDPPVRPANSSGKVLVQPLLLIEQKILAQIKDQEEWDRECPPSAWCFVTFLDPEDPDHPGYV